MPLRRWFTAHQMPGWYSWVILFLLTIASIGISVLVNAKLAEKAIRQSQQQAARQGEIVRHAVCLVVQAQEDVFSGSQTPTGEKARAAWHELRELFQCDHQ